AAWVPGAADFPGTWGAMSRMPGCGWGWFGRDMSGSRRQGKAGRTIVKAEAKGKTSMRREASATLLQKPPVGRGAGVSSGLEESRELWFGHKRHRGAKLLELRQPIG